MSAAPSAGRLLPWVGYRADDVHGRHVGTVAAVLVDREQGVPVWLLVHLARSHKHVVVPPTGVVAGAGHVMLPWPRTTLVDLPDVPAEGTLTARQERRAADALGVQPARPVPMAWERRRVTAPARLDELGAVVWTPAPRGTPAVPGGVVLRVVLLEHAAGEHHELRERLQARPEVATVAVPAGAGRALDVVARARPHVVVVSVTSGRRQGIALLADLLARVPARVLALTDAELAPVVRHELRGRGQVLVDATVGEQAQSIELRALTVVETLPPA